MNRRDFLKTVGATVVASAVPRLPIPPTETLAKYQYQTYALAYSTAEGQIAEGIGQRMAKALAQSLMQTRWIVAAQILEPGFGLEGEQQWPEDQIPETTAEPSESILTLTDLSENDRRNLPSIKIPEPPREPLSIEVKSWSKDGPTSCPSGLSIGYPTQLFPFA